MKNPYVKWLIIALVVIIAIVAIVLIVKALQAPTQPPVAPTAPGSKLASEAGSILQQIITGGWLKKIFGGGGSSVACDPSNPGYDNAGNYTAACGGTPGGGGSNCDPNRPGYDMNGFLSTQCGA